ncbi:MAG: hypothetical protein HY231_00350 [Acidobacteria bacterium]|nr:hypothetical protein [Acidobacteriota bacterium]
MKFRPITCIAVVALCGLWVGVLAQGQNIGTGREAAAKAPRPLIKGPIKSPTGASFNIAPSSEVPGEFQVVITDGDEQVVSGAFNLIQLEVLKAIMDEARKFALSEEGVDKGQPTTSRFSTKEERSFIVDVTKSATQSQFFFTLQTQIGRLTLDAGAIKRNDKREESFFFDIRARIEAAIASALAPASR